MDWYQATQSLFTGNLITAGLTSVTCAGGMLPGVNAMLFFEISDAPFFSTTLLFPGNLSSVTCDTSEPLSGLAVFAVASFAQNQNGSLPTITFSPQSTGLNPVLTLEAGEELTNGGNETSTTFAVATYSGQDDSAPTFNLSTNGTFNQSVPPGCAVLLFRPAAQFLDPVPSLMRGRNVVGTNAGADKLATLGRPITGVAADWVSQAVIRIPAVNAGEQFTLTMINDQNSPSVSADEDGALGNPGDATLNITQSQISVTAVNTASGPFAFAVYRAPADFARSGNTRDPTAASRKVSVQISDSLGNVILPGSTFITIVRPPVALIHGVWSSWETWDTFSPLVTGRNTVDSRFSVLRVSYDGVIGRQITLSNPAYSADALSAAKANSMGFAYNAPAVLSQMQDWLQKFKTGQNPASVPVAAAQFDVVAHSMGGDIARTLPLLSSFQSNGNFGLGEIHKAITIGTLHQGTPVATQVLNSNSGCLRVILAAAGDLVFASATVAGTTSTGAVGDMTPGSPAIQAIQGSLPALIPPNTAPVPTGMIAGQYTNWASLNCTFCGAGAARTLCSNDPTAQLLTPTGWQTIFPAQDPRNDSMVGVASQLNGLGDQAGFVYQGFLHSPALTKLSFAAPTEMDSNTAISNQVIQLLNTPVTGSVFQLLGPSNL